MRIFPCRFVLLENNYFCGCTTGRAFLWFCHNWTIPRCWAFRLFLASLHHMLLPGCICPRICAHISDSGLRTDFSDSESSENTSILNLKLIKCESSSNFMLLLVEPVGIPRLEQSRGWRRRTGLGIPLETWWFIYLGEGEKKRWLHLKHLCIFHSCQQRLWCNETTELPTGAWLENKMVRARQRGRGAGGLQSQKKHDLFAVTTRPPGVSLPRSVCPSLHPFWLSHKLAQPAEPLAAVPGFNRLQFGMRWTLIFVSHE